MNAYSFFRRGFPRNQDAVLLETDDGRTVTYGDLERETARVAGLLTRLGVEVGGRVAAQVDKSPAGLFLYLGCLRAGACFLPLNTAYRRDELAYFLADAEPAVAVCRPDRKAEFSVARRVFTLDADGAGTFAEAMGEQPDRFEDRDVADDALAVIIYTSGTTGRSKGAMLTHGNIAANADALREAWRITADDVLLHALPIFHVHGLFVGINPLLLAGARLIWHPRFDPAAALSALPRATLFMGVPTYYTRLLREAALTREHVHGVRLFVSGSAPLQPEVFAAWERQTGHAILERYGMSEAGMITSNPLAGERRAGTVGLPLPGVAVRVADAAGRVLGAGEAGGVEVAGPSVFAGYWRMPEKTREEFTPDGWFRTGDLGRFDADGYLSLVGRAKDLVISGGYNVYPREVEAVIDELPSVQESAVFGVPDPDFGEAVTVAVVPRPDTAPRVEKALEQAVIAHVKERLANYKVPKRVYVVPELPRNAMGKVQKTQLRDRFTGS